MFGSLGFQEILLIMIIALLVVGPGKLPEFARTLGKFFSEFRNTVNDARKTIQDEIEKTEISSHIKEIDNDLRNLSRSEPGEGEK